VFSATSCGVVVVFLNISGVNVALPTITRELGASAGQAGWVLLAYMLLTTALILAFGRLADIVGRRPLYLAGFAVFTAATAACAASPSAELLIAARAVQAVGAAALVTNTTPLLTDAFPASSLPRALGLNATVAAVSQAAGPLLGGAATALLGWRGTFLLTLPLCALGLCWSLLVLPRTRRPAGTRQPFDLAGAVLSTLALAATVLALSPDALRAVTPGAAGARGPLVAGGLAVLTWGAFALLQARRRHPLVDLRLVAHRVRAPLYAAVLLNAAAQYAVVVLASLVLQAAGHHDALTAGLLVSPVAVGTTVAAVAAGHLVGRAGARVLTTVGSAVVLAGILALTVVLRPGSSYWLVGPALAAVGVGTGLFMTPGTSTLMLTVGPSARGAANGVRSALQNVGYLLSTALALGIATSGLAAGDRAAAYAGTLGSAGPAGAAEFAAGVRAAFVVLAVLAALALLACWALPGRPDRSGRSGGSVPPDRAPTAEPPPPPRSPTDSPAEGAHP
jgi:MFS family permease